MKRKILKLIGKVSVFYRMNFDIGRDARLAVIEYKMQPVFSIDEILLKLMLKQEGIYFND